MTLFVTFLFLLFIVTPFSLLIHEIGHAIGARMIGASKIVITIGIGKTLLSIRLKRVTMKLRAIFIVHFQTETKRRTPLSKPEAIVVAMMGPVFSFCISLILFICYNLFIPHPSVQLLYLFNLWLAVVNLIPFKLGHKHSDGYIVIEQLRKA